ACDDYLARINDPVIKDKLREETENAVAAGVFGVPTVIVGDQLFWGNDQFDHIRLLLDDNDPLDKEKVAAMDTRERAIDRKHFVQKSKQPG
ncbi:MAG: DsbA family protein, partial [Pseudomonadales bacterium]|nr:DsbA family protein [Pseudomonadales bacterium]